MGREEKTEREGGVKSGGELREKERRVGEVRPLLDQRRRLRGIREWKEEEVDRGRSFERSNLTPGEAGSEVYDCEGVRRT